MEAAIYKTKNSKIFKSHLIANSEDFIANLVITDVFFKAQLLESRDCMRISSSMKKEKKSKFTALLIAEKVLKT